MSISFDELFSKVRGNCQIPNRMLCLDPGETTGWALFEDHQLVRWGQIPTVVDGKIKWHELDLLFIDTMPDYVVCEDYRVYDHKLDRHSYSQVPTLRLIGGIDLMCNLGWYTVEEAEDVDNSYYEQHTCPIHYQMAVTAKSFCTDEKLKQWGFWQEGMRHSRDAIRHGCYFLLFFNKGKNIDY